jgi:hypothetical protein
MDYRLLRQLVRSVLRSTTAEDESETARNGPLSTKAEWHTVGIGAGFGFLTGSAYVLASPALAEPVVGLAVVVLLAASGYRAGADPPIARNLLRQVRKELPYYLVSFALGLLPWLPAVMPA